MFLFTFLCTSVKEQFTLCVFLTSVADGIFCIIYLFKYLFYLFKAKQQFNALVTGIQKIYRKRKMTISLLLRTVLVLKTHIQFCTSVIFTFLTLNIILYLFLYHETCKYLLWHMIHIYKYSGEHLLYFFVNILIWL